MAGIRPLRSLGRYYSVISFFGHARKMKIIQFDTALLSLRFVLHSELSAHC